METISMLAVILALVFGICSNVKWACEERRNDERLNEERLNEERLRKEKDES